MAIMTRLRHLRHGQFARVRHQRRLLAFLAAQDTRLTASATAKTVDTVDVAAAFAVGTLTLGANAGNGKLVTIGGRIYTFKTNLTEVKAAGTATTDNTNPVDASTVTLGTTVYTFQTSLTAGTAGQVHVKIGVDADTSLLNLARAINNSGGTPGTDYNTTGTAAHPTVASAASVTSHAIAITAKLPGVAGNIASTSTTSPNSHVTFGGSALTGGVDAVLNEVKISGTNASGSIDNLIAAINADTGAGSTYATGTLINADVAAAAGTGDTMDVTAKTVGGIANSIPTTTDVASASWGAVNLTGGAFGSFGPNFTATAHGISNGEGPYVLTSTSAVPTVVGAALDLLWVAVIGVDTIALGRTREAALRGDYVHFSSAGSGTISLTKQMTSGGIYGMLRTNKPETMVAATDVDALA